MWQILLAGILCIITYRYLLRKPGRLNTPPMVPGLPLLGNVNQVQAPALHHGLSKLAQKHGAIFTISMMGSKMVVVNTPELIQEASITRGDDFIGRSAAPYIIKMVTYDAKSLSFIQHGKTWKVLRKAVQTGLKTPGEGKANPNDEMQQVLEDLVEKYREAKNQPVNPHPHLKMAVNNVMSSLVMGRTVMAGTNEADTLMQLEADTMVCVTPGFGAELDLLPFLRWLPINSAQILKRVIRNRNKAVDEMFNKMKATYDPARNRGLVDTLIQAQMKYRTPSGEPIIEDINVKGAVLDMYLAGAISSFSIVSSMMLVSLHYPQVQEKLQQEIDTVIGQNQHPAIHHRPAMHFFNATVLELLRYISVGTLALRATTRDTKLAEFDIPKDMPVIMNLWEVHHSQDWGDPWVFRPERFLDDDGKLVPVSHPNRQRVISFGLGPRACIGEALARNIIFLFIATLWKKFSFLPVKGQPLPSCDPREFTACLQVYPKDYVVNIMER